MGGKCANLTKFHKLTMFLNFWLKIKYLFQEFIFKLTSLKKLIYKSFLFNSNYVNLKIKIK